MIMPITDLSRLQRGTGPTQHWGVQPLASTADCCAAGALMVLTLAAPAHAWAAVSPRLVF